MRHPKSRRPVQLGWSCRLLALACLLTLQSCFGYPTIREAAPGINQTRIKSPQFLIPEDNLDVRIGKRPEWNQTVAVREDGTASFLFFGEMQVAGLTPAQLAQRLTEKFKNRPDLVADPSVTVNITTPAPRHVIVTGEVGAPGPVLIEDNHLSLVEAIGKAGGFDKATARLTEVLLVRWLPHEGKLKSWWLDASVAYWGDGTPILLQTHDLIHIPNTTIDRVNIWVDKWIRQNLPIPLGIPVAN